VIENCEIGQNVDIPFPDLCNIYGATIGAGSFVGPFVEIQKDVKIGPNCRIQSHSFICSLVEIGASVFIGHGVMFCNDSYPYAGNDNPDLQPVFVGDGATIGTNATILPGVTIGAGALIGAGSVVTKDVLPTVIAYGNPALCTT